MYRDLYVLTNTARYGKVWHGSRNRQLVVYKWTGKPPRSIGCKLLTSKH